MGRHLPAPRPADPAALARSAQRLARAATPPWLHVEIARRMAERLPLIKRQPRTVVDWDARAGGGAGALKRACPRSRLVAVEPFAAPAPAARPWWRLRGGESALDPADVPAGQADLLWSNMSLHRAADPLATLQAWHAATAVDGFLMFSTLGPGTLQALTALYAAQGWGPPFAPFVDMHDLGDMLLAAGWADPVMDQEQITLTWPDGAAALAELRGLGGNADPGRARGLRTPRWRDALGRLLEQGAGVAERRVALTFEVVYGHAFRVAPRSRDATKTEVTLDDMRAQLPSRRDPRPR